MEPPRKLWNRDFLLLWLGQLTSLLGSQVFTIAILVWLKHATGSATLIGLLGMAGSIPALLAGPFSGALADRWPRKILIVSSDLIQGGTRLALAAAVVYAGGASDAVIALLFGVVVVSSLTTSVAEPATMAVLPELVPPEQLGRANSANLALFRIASLGGPGVGGIAFRLLGAPFLFLIDGVSFLLSGIAKSLVRMPSISGDRGLSGIGGEIMEGLRFVWQRHGLRTMFLSVAVMNFLITPIVILLPFYIEDTLALRVDWYGYLLAGLGAGSLAGYALVSARPDTPQIRSRLMIAALVGTGVGILLLGIVQQRFGALAVFSFTGVASGVFNVSARTLLQVAVPSNMRGRVFGTMGTLTRSLSPLSMGIAGVAADLTGQNVPLIYTVCGVLLLGTVTVVALNPTFQQFLLSGPETEMEIEVEAEA